MSKIPTMKATRYASMLFAVALAPITLAALCVKASALALHAKLGKGRGTRETAYREDVYRKGRFALHIALRGQGGPAQQEALLWGALLCAYAREYDTCTQYLERLIKRFPAGPYVKDAQEFLDVFPELSKGQKR